MRIPPVVYLLCLGIRICHAQYAFVQGASSYSMPTETVDGNSPAFWDGEKLRVYTSTGSPVAMSGPNLFTLYQDSPPVVEPRDHYPLWIEGVWRDTDGTVYAWYHNEPGDLCNGKKLTAPRIGALVSRDGGTHFQDLGIVLSSGDPLDCDAQNGFFAGGHGDFSIILDRERRYFYFFFTSYAGGAQRQGISTARMAYEDRGNPVGAVRKFHDGAWDEAGVGGAVSPVFPARVGWESEHADSFWGPAVHWNTFLNRHVMLLNRACCQTNWPQEGIYIAYSDDLSNPLSWTAPEKILDANQIGFAPAYYPQVFGTGAGESDTQAGEIARFFIKGFSRWEIIFSAAPPVIEENVDENFLNRTPVTVRR
ncbi:MAG: hypothetical protein ABIZ80_26170 [Bryobacteraceae bacterium]